MTPRLVFRRDQQAREFIDAACLGEALESADRGLENQSSLRNLEPHPACRERRAVPRHGTTNFKLDFAEHCSRVRVSHGGAHGAQPTTEGP